MLLLIDPLLLPLLLIRNYVADVAVAAMDNRSIAAADNRSIDRSIRGISGSVSPLLVKNSLMSIRDNRLNIDVIVNNFTIENTGQSLQNSCVIC